MISVPARPGRIESDAGKAAQIAYRSQGPIRVWRRLAMEGDRVGAGGGEGLDVALRRLDHQVDVDRAAGGVDPVGDRGRDQRSDRDRRDEVAVHHVEVDHPRAGVHHLLDLSPQS